MSKVLVLELPDDADIAQALLAIHVTARAHVAIGEAADVVLAVFDAPPPIQPEEQP